MVYKNIHNIGLSILLIGLLNIYNIIKGGSKIEIGQEIIIIESFNIKILIFITIILSIILNYIYWKKDIIQEKEDIGNNKFHTKCGNKENILEYDLLIGFSLIGLILLTISNDLILIYLGLELYSYSIYVLILVKETILIRRISIIYLILSSLMSALILYSFALLYKYSGSLNLESIYNIFVSSHLSLSLRENIEIGYIIYLIILGFLFKLGTGPFIYWVLRVYSELSKRIFWYQLTIPKFIFFILLLKFLAFSHHTSVNSSLIYTIYSIAIISIIIGTIGGLFQKKDNMLLSYSSVLNIGYLLLSLSIIYILYSSAIIEQNILENSQLWILIQFFFVYIINLLGLFSIFFLFSRSSFVFTFKSFFTNPFFYICFIILILSFIGFPPLSGFFSKFYLFYSLFSYPNLTIISVSIFILSTLISSFFYFKFLFASSIDSTSNPSLDQSIILENTFQPKLDPKGELIYKGLEYKKASIILASTTLFTILYPFYFSSFYPFFNY